MTLPDGKSNKDRVQGYVGPIYIADAALYLKAHNPELGITDPYELTQAQFDAAVALLARAAQDRPEVLGRLPGPGRGLQDGRLRGCALLAAAGEPARGRRPADRQHDSAGRRDRLGRHHHDVRPRRRIRTAPTCGSSIRSIRRCRAMWRPGLARTRPCRPAARPASCWGPMAARPTATTTSTRSLSGRRRSPTVATARATA